MFETLTERLGTVFEKLRGRGVLSEADVISALRDIRIALLEADVALPVAKSFVQAVQQQATGQEVLRSITPGQMVVKIVHDHLVDLLRHPDGSTLNLKAHPPVVVLMVGLQGSGKTTTTAKLAHFLKQKERQKVLMASVDVYRPAAQEQLEILGQSIDVETCPIISGETPRTIAKRALTQAKQKGFDVLLVDTAGRLHLDEALMKELVDLQNILSPTETLLVADAMMGKDALTMAQAFHERLRVTGFVLSRVDGDARGGAALSIRHVTNTPLKFLGVGEKPDQLEPFHPDRIASRILGMGDVVSLVEKVSETVSQEDMERLKTQMQKGVFTLDDLAQQLTQMQKMGGIGTLMNLLPGVKGLKDKMDAQSQEKAAKMIRRQQAILSSMTPRERRNPQILNGSRRKRIARGSGVLVPDVNRLLKQFEEMRTMMKRMNKMGKMRKGLQGLLGKNPLF